ncbi:MAG: hypothetical protein ACJA1B_001898 [Polaribacter sp.]|jgi:hypothetical protein
MNLLLKKTLLTQTIFKFSLLVIFLTKTITPLFAQGNLLVYPTRIVFDTKENIEKVVLTNTGEDTAIYNISFVEYKMTKYGQMKVISLPEEGLNFASTNLRYFPRRVILGPYQSQTLKVQLRNAKSLADGEYRSHLYFRGAEDKGKLEDINKKKDTSSISVQLKPIFGISIPCIVRKGENNTTVTITDPELTPLNTNESTLKFHLNRIGNMSVYGDLSIHYIDKKNKVTKISQVNGVGIYTPGNLRIINIKLNPPKNINFDGGTLHIVFTKNKREEILSETNLAL